MFADSSRPVAPSGAFRQRPARGHRRDLLQKLRIPVLALTRGPVPVLLVLVPEPRHLLARSPHLRRLVSLHLVQAEVRDPLHAPRARPGVGPQLLVYLHRGLEGIGEIVEKLLEVPGRDFLGVLDAQRGGGVSHFFANVRHAPPPVVLLPRLLDLPRVPDLRLPRGVLRPLLHLLRAVAAVKLAQLVPVLVPAEVHLGAVVSDHSPVIVQRRLDIRRYVPILVVGLGLDLRRLVVRAALSVPDVAPHRREQLLPRELAPVVQV